MPTAKTYKDWEIVSDIFEKNKKMYVTVRKPGSGAEKEVRWYSDAEYMKMYPEVTKMESRLRSVKETLGFEKGYITIFKGNLEPLEDWFRASVCRYNVLFGWFCPSEIELPETLPAGIEPIQLKWEEVAEAGSGAIKPDSVVKAIVESLVCEPSTSQWVGQVGERLDLTLVCTKVVKIDNGHFGSSSFHVFEDQDGNQFCWNTSAKTLEIGTQYNLRGTVKEHKVYKGSRQTVLLRCTIKS